MEFDEDLVCYVAQVEIDPRVLGAHATLAASLGRSQATCEVVVGHRNDDGPSLQITIVNEAGGKYRTLENVAVKEL